MVPMSLLLASLHIAFSITEPRQGNELLHSQKGNLLAFSSVQFSSVGR